ncbi:four helix bundle protein [Candidatus Gottesmanbacteria bacterium]|nr:four helix bundle protein [Candidatus Gottesmanbacteria bacterium]
MEERGYRKLIVWKRMQELVVLIYRLTETFPKSETFGLQGQMRRAVVSVISNFIEGYLKRSKKEKLQFLERSETSLLELIAQGEVCLVVGYLTEESYQLIENKKREVGYLPSFAESHGLLKPRAFSPWMNANGGPQTKPWRSGASPLLRKGSARPATAGRIKRCHGL